MSIYMKTLVAVVLLCNALGVIIVSLIQSSYTSNGRSDRGTEDSPLFDKSKILRVKHYDLIISTP